MMHISGNFVRLLSFFRIHCSNYSLMGLYVIEVEVFYGYIKS